ncbi:hypothetical protein EV401DRAFT_570550 [Pisolithus croceorrhizus]|nr:hypothetical protein EV401DRAFT_570550 [Pisolithus croceorrhizus]
MHAGIRCTRSSFKCPNRPIALSLQCTGWPPGTEHSVENGGTHLALRKGFQWQCSTWSEVCRPMICADKTEDAARTSLFQRESELRWSMWKWRASRKQVHASMSLDDYMVPAIRRCSAGPYLANLLICAVLTFLASPGIYEVIYEPRLNAHNAYRHFECAPHC